MTTLKYLVVWAKSLVILTIAMAGAAVLNSLLTETWRGVAVLVSQAS
jgi:hypothetical protein